MDLSTEARPRERRRGERVLIRVAIQVNGTGKDGKPVHSPAEAVVVNRNGALLRVPHPLKNGSTLEVYQGQEKQAKVFRVIWCSDRPREGRHDDRRHGRRRRSEGACERAQERVQERVQECIAVGRDLWFEGLGFPHPANVRQGPNPWRKPHRQQVASSCRGRALGFGAGQRQS